MEGCVSQPLRSLCLVFGFIVIIRIKLYLDEFNLVNTWKVKVHHTLMIFHFVCIRNDIELFSLVSFNMFLLFIFLSSSFFFYVDLVMAMLT